MPLKCQAYSLGDLLVYLPKNCPFQLAVFYELTDNAVVTQARQ